MRFRRNRHLLVVGALWAVLGGIVALVTSQMGDWYAMTDEMRYERLAISIAQTHSLVPRIHGVDIQSFAQLYPLLIAPVFGHGLVPSNLRDAHLLNAFVMTSACIPAYLLCRRVTERRSLALVAAALSVVMPWTLRPLRRIEPAPRNPIPVTICAAMRSGVPPTWASSRETIVKSADPTAISMFVRRPAAF